MARVGPPHRSAAKSRRVSFCLLRPAHEVARPRGGGGCVAGQPGVQVALAGGGQGEAAGGQPVQQRDCGFDVLSGRPRPARGWCRCRRVGGVAGAGGARRRSGAAVALLGVGAVGDGVGDPAFQPDHLLVAGRQRADRDQHAAQVLDRLAGGQFVERLVREHALAGLELAQDRGAALRSSQAATVLGRSVAVSAW